MSAKLTLTGVKEIDRELKKLTNLTRGGINSAMRGASRDSMKSQVFPKAKAALEKHKDTGDLRKALKVRGIKRSKIRVGTVLGFTDPMYKGPTFYGGFLEFGTKDRTTKSTGAYRGKVPADSFLRKPLYDSEAAVRAAFVEALAARVKKANAKAAAKAAKGK